MSCLQGPEKATLKDKQKSRDLNPQAERKIITIIIKDSTWGNTGILKSRKLWLSQVRSADRLIEAEIMVHYRPTWDKPCLFFRKKSFASWPNFQQSCQAVFIELERRRAGWASCWNCRLAHPQADTIQETPPPPPPPHTHTHTANSDLCCPTAKWNGKTLNLEERDTNCSSHFQQAQQTKALPTT